MMYVLNRQFKMIGILENDSETGMNYYDDRLEKTSGDGFYIGSCVVEKRNGIEDVIKEGNYITLQNRRGEQLLMTIMTLDETSETIYITYEDIGLDLINGYINELIEPVNPQPVSYYLEETLKGTGWKVGTVETIEALKLEFTKQQSILERLQEIIKAFGGLPKYSVEFDGLRVKDFFVHVLKPRDSYKTVRFDTDVNINDIRRKVDMTDFASRILVRGSTQQVGVDEETEEVIDPTEPITPTGNWRPQIVDRRNRAMGGQSNDRPLSQITHIAIHYTSVARSMNRTIESHENYWRTTHGWPVGGYHVYIDSQGVVHRNYNYERQTYGVGGNNAYTVHVSVEANSSADYSQAQLKSRDWVVRKFMKDLNVPAQNAWQHCEYPGNESQVCAGYTKTQMNQIRTELQKPNNDYLLEWANVEGEVQDDIIERAITIAHSLVGTPYAWGGVTRSGFDCSGLIYLAYREAGFTNITHRCTTYTMWNQQAPFYRINTSERKRGDLVMMDTVGNPPGHVGIYLGDDMMLHTGGPNGVRMTGPVSIKNYRVMGYVRVRKP